MRLHILMLALGLAVSSGSVAWACPPGYVACGQNNQLCCPGN
jgi:hypothetical protein